MLSSLARRSTTATVRASVNAVAAKRCAVRLNSTSTSTSSNITNATQSEPLSLSKSQLIRHPELWKGLPANVVVQLYRARVISLGKNYQKSETELQSILSTAKNPVEAQALYNIYNSTEADIYKADSETDYDNYITEGEYMEDPLEPYGFDEYPTGAQDIVRDFRDLMEFNRKAAFELPKLVQYRKPYTPISKNEAPAIYKYTRFIGESHPGERKVTVHFKLSDLSLSAEESHKFKLVAGPRYDHKTDIFLMSCDRYLEPAQNATFLSDVLDDLIAESKRDPQEFANLPLDKRHTAAKYVKKQRKNSQYIPFPKEWEKPQSKQQRHVRLSDVVDTKTAVPPVSI